jgi:hypothetical protein
MLTETAKEDFKRWYRDRLSVMTHSDLLNINDETVYNALILEWFDTTSFYVNVLKYGDRWNYIVDQQYPKSFKTRQEAISAAIVTANNLYNDNQF